MEIKIDNEKTLLIDEEDYPIFKKYNWRINSYGYLVAHLHNGYKSYSHLIFHRLITNCPKKMQIDHINRNRLDNRKENLRIVTQAENLKNKSKYKNNKTGFRGVSFCKRNNVYRAYVSKNGKKIMLGSFSDPVEAAKAYDIEAKRILGKYAELNF